MPAISATAPGKVILFGEHAVVYGRPAIAVPVTQVKARAVVTAAPRGAPGEVRLLAPDIGLDAILEELGSADPLAAAIREVASTLKVKQFPACTIKITSTIPVAAGMGSGAAVSVALIRALSAFFGHPLPDEKVSALAFEIEKIHHGTPSGIDNTVVTYSMPVYFVKGKPIETLQVRRPFTIVIGDTGVSSPTGAAAYVLALEELLAQCAASELEGCPPDWIVFPSSSGGTHAGLALGARLHGFTGKVLGISVDQLAGALKARVAALAQATAELLGESVQFSPDDILADDGYLGGGYGVLGEAEREAVRLFARSEGLLLDPVYTGRAAAGMVDLIRKGFFSRDETVLFWHTGGTPALFADKYRDLVTF